MSAIRELSTSGTLAADDCLPLMTRKLDSEIFSDSLRRVLRVRLIRFIAASDYTIQRRMRRPRSWGVKKALSSRSGPWGRALTRGKPSTTSAVGLPSMPFSKLTLNTCEKAVCSKLNTAGTLFGFCNKGRVSGKAPKSVRTNGTSRLRFPARCEPN
jgi:hypothetical protein